jgi:transcriptional regulator with XRE-family HTH domain
MTSEEGEELPVFPGFRGMAQRRRGLLAELVAQRRSAGLSQAEVAARMGTSQSAVARLESGAVDARLSTLERYAGAVHRRLDLRLRDGGAEPRRASTTERVVRGRGLDE